MPPPQRLPIVSPSSRDLAAVLLPLHLDIMTVTSWVHGGPLALPVALISWDLSAVLLLLPLVIMIVIRRIHDGPLALTAPPPPAPVNGWRDSSSADPSSRVVPLRRTPACAVWYSLPLLEVLLQQALLEPAITSGAVSVKTTLLSRLGRHRGVHQPTRCTLYTGTWPATVAKEVEVEDEVEPGKARRKSSVCWLLRLQLWLRTVAEN